MRTLNNDFRTNKYILDKTLTKYDQNFTLEINTDKKKFYCNTRVSQKFFNCLVTTSL